MLKHLRQQGAQLMSCPQQWDRHPYIRTGADVARVSSRPEDPSTPGLHRSAAQARQPHDGRQPSLPHTCGATLAPARHLCSSGGRGGGSSSSGGSGGASSRGSGGSGGGGGSKSSGCGPGGSGGCWKPGAAGQGQVVGESC
jgi:uncharacterized membrane protein YgcG